MNQLSSDALLKVKDLRVEFALPGQAKPLRAVDGVSFDVGVREVLGVIGESGSGKSSVARAIMRLNDIAGGEVVIGGNRFDQLRGRDLRRERRRVQMVFQDPHESLDPRMTVRQAVREPLILAGSTRSRREIDDRVVELVHLVGLDEAHLDRRPNALSGGQKQRVNIARALALEPQLLICDEAVSALDVSVQAGIINLLLKLQDDLGISVLFISHDLSVVAHLSDRIGVMYLGRVVEIAPAESLTQRPRHPYTEALLASEPQARPSSSADPRPPALLGDVPSAMDPPSGCRFRTRCRYAQDVCVSQEPPLLQVGDALVACHFAEGLDLVGRRS